MDEYAPGVPGAEDLISTFPWLWKSRATTIGDDVEVRILCCLEEQGTYPNFRGVLAEAHVTNVDVTDQVLYGVCRIVAGTWYQKPAEASDLYGERALSKKWKTLITHQWCASFDANRNLVVSSVARVLPVSNELQVAEILPGPAFETLAPHIATFLYTRHRLLRFATDLRVPLTGLPAGLLRTAEQIKERLSAAV